MPGPAEPLPIVRFVIVLTVRARAYALAGQPDMARYARMVRDVEAHRTLALLKHIPR